MPLSSEEFVEEQINQLRIDFADQLNELEDTVERLRDRVKQLEERNVPAPDEADEPPTPNLVRPSAQAQEPRDRPGMGTPR